MTAACAVLRKHSRTSFKIDMGLKEGKKNPAKILPGDHIEKSLPRDSQRESDLKGVE